MTRELAYNSYMFIKVRVKAEAKKEELKKISDILYAISVKQPAERNLANARVCEIMASVLAVDIKAVRIISGHHSPSKILSINI